MNIRQIFIASAFSILFIIATLTPAQTTDFSSDYEEFVDQMDDIFKLTNDKKKAKLFIDELRDFMQSDANKQLKDQMIYCCNEGRKRKAHPYPNYYDYIKTFMNLSKTDKLSGSNYNVWWDIFVEKMSKKATKLSTLTNYLSTIDDYIIDRTFFKNQSLSWHCDAQNVVFKNINNQLVLEIPETRIVCVAHGDSAEIFNTSGTYNTETHIWNGNKGIITWERCGLPREQTWAEFTEYKLDMARNAINIDSVTFNNKNYFDHPLIGSVEHKVTNIHNEQSAKYPKFHTSSERYDIKNIFPQINYVGGFSQIGASFQGSSSDDAPAELNIFRNDTLFINLQAPSFVLFTDRIETQTAAVQIYLDDEYITHPCVRFRYFDNKREITLTRGGNGLENSLYYDSFHKVTMDVEYIKWQMDKTDIDLGMIEGSALSLAIFESTSYYREEYYNKLQGMEMVHPFQDIADFYKYYGGQPFYVADYAKYRSLPEASVRQMLIRLSFDGFINYDINNDLAQPTERLLDYLQFRLGKKDYDVIRFTSELSDNIVCGVLDLKNYDIQLNGVTDVSISDNQNIFFYPEDGKITLKRNRDFKFNGSIEAGMISLSGTGFYFSYDDYRIELNKIDDMMLKVATDEVDLYGKRRYDLVQNMISDLSGYLEIDEPDNKSGRRVNPQYPRLTSTKESYVYYDAKRIQNGQYKRDNFYYAVDPFIFEGVNNITFDNTEFTGVLHSNIFPPIRQNLVVRKTDNSLGFETNTPAEGYEIYNGKAHYRNNIDLSNSGLRGSGDLEYLTSKSSSKDFLFLPDEVNGLTNEFTIAETTTGVTYPGVELGHNQTGAGADGNTTYGQSWLVYKPQLDYLNTSNTISKFQMFPNKNSLSGFDCSISGTITLTPQGLRGIGEVGLPKKAKMEAAVMDFTDHTIVADTAFFAQYKYSQVLLKDSLQSDGLRRDLLENDSTSRIARERRRVYNTTSAQIPLKSFYNEALHENAVFNDIYKNDQDITNAVLTKSMSATIDFQKREGYFTYKNIAGGEKTYATIKYRTWVRQFTWDMERNSQVIGQKGSQPGLRFVCTKEKRDSLQFYVPYAQFNADDDALYCEEVKYINTADARVNLDKEGHVTIHTDAKMDPLDNSSIELRTDSTYHNIYDAKVIINGAKKYHGIGYYDFYNKMGEKIPIFMSEISADDQAVTNTRGSISEEIKLDEHFAYKGDLKIRNGRQLLEFDGGARMIHNAPDGPKGFVRFDDIINPQLVVIPIGEKITNWPKDEIFRDFFLRKDSSHVYSAFIESRKDHSDIELLHAEGVLFYNKIFDRFDITTREKRAKIDTVGTIMSFIPNENAITGFGPVHTGLYESVDAPMDIITSGSIRHNRTTNTVKLSTLMGLDFHLDNGLVTKMYTTILNSKAAKCDSTSARYIARYREIADTVELAYIQRNASLPLDPKTGLLPDFGYIFTFNDVELTWDTRKHTYYCDTIVNLMMMRNRYVNRAIRMKAEFTYHKTGNTINIELEADNNTWFFFGYRSGNMQVLSSDKEFNDLLQLIDIKERRDKSRKTTYTLASASRRKRFLDGFGPQKTKSAAPDDEDDEFNEDNEQFVDYKPDAEDVDSDKKENKIDKMLEDE